MIRLHVICEGQTEEMFVNQVLYETFLAKDIYLLPTLIGKPGHKGGNFRFERLFPDVRERLLSDPASYCTTFFDFYGLPDDFPGKEDAKKVVSIEDKANCLTEALTGQLKKELGDAPLQRFIPYVQMYEFEALLFSSPTELAEGINQKNLATSFQDIRGAFPSPEHINDSPTTAPSKRIKRLFPEYEKPIYGSLAALEMGLNTIREECPLFNGWLQMIEVLPTGGDS